MKYLLSNSEAMNFVSPFLRCPEFDVDVCLDKVQFYQKVIKNMVELTNLCVSAHILIKK